jgi:hypothetical protein
MMRTMAILGVLLSQAISACAPGTMVVCVHQGGRAHVGLVSGACCHENKDSVCCGRTSCGHRIHAVRGCNSHPASLDLAHLGEPNGSSCPGHLASAATAADRCGDESEPCTDYPLVISQLRCEHQRGTFLAADSPACIAAVIDQAPALLASTCHGRGATRALAVSPVLTALSTVVLRC